jgi:hypothetical protein
MLDDQRDAPAVSDVPAGAKKLGCRNCRVGDRQRHPQLGMLYCDSCPVINRMRRRGINPDRFLLGVYGGRGHE